jgi:hypothetical protein
MREIAGASGAQRAGLILYGLTITFAAIDWVMSIDLAGSPPSLALRS